MKKKKERKSKEGNNEEEKGNSRDGKKGKRCDAPNKNAGKKRNKNTAGNKT